MLALIGPHSVTSNKKRKEGGGDHASGVGVDQVIFGIPNVAELEAFDILANEVIPTVEQLPVAGRG